MKLNDKNEIIKTSIGLMKIPSTKDNEKARKDVIAFVKKYFSKEDVFIKEFKENGIYSIVVNLKNEKNPKLFLNGHLDVVPDKKDGFSPKILGSKLYGRGSGDMKGGVAVMMKVLKDLANKKDRPSVGLMLTTDEEVGGKNGVAFLLREKKYISKFVIVPDGGKNLSEIILNQKGILHLKIKAHGISAHGSRPWLGENAITELIKYYNEIQKTIPPIKNKEWRNSLNLGNIIGGKNINSVPNYAEMCLDIRYIKINERAKILDKIKKITNSNFEIVNEGFPFTQIKNNIFLKKYVNIASKEIGNKIIFNKSEGASDARFFSEKGIPAIITKINCANIHADNEWIDINEMEIFYNILHKFIKDLNI